MSCYSPKQTSSQRSTPNDHTSLDVVKELEEIDSGLIHRIPPCRRQKDMITAWIKNKPVSWEISDDGRLARIKPLLLAIWLALLLRPKYQWCTMLPIPIDQSNIYCSRVWNRAQLILSMGARPFYVFFFNFRNKHRKKPISDMTMIITQRRNKIRHTEVLKSKIINHTLSKKSLYSLYFHSLGSDLSNHFFWSEYRVNRTRFHSLSSEFSLYWS